MTRVRFAPSPTGTLHVGNALSAVANRGSATGCCCGSTTPTRPGTSRAARRACSTTSPGSGVAWDEGPVRQSSRAARHLEAARAAGLPQRFEGVMLWRDDETPTFHLASVVDDADFAITHVIRGSDHRPNEELHAALHRALGTTPPEVIHHGLVVGDDGKKLSKRAEGATVASLREAGLPGRGGARVPRRARPAAARRPPRPRADPLALGRRARRAVRRGARRTARRPRRGGAARPRRARPRRGGVRWSAACSTHRVPTWHKVPRRSRASSSCGAAAGASRQGRREGAAARAEGGRRQPARAAPRADRARARARSSGRCCARCRGTRRCAALYPRAVRLYDTVHALAGRAAAALRGRSACTSAARRSTRGRTSATRGRSWSGCGFARGCARRATRRRSCTTSRTSTTRSTTPRRARAPSSPRARPSGTCRTPADLGLGMPDYPAEGDRVGAADRPLHRAADRRRARVPGSRATSTSASPRFPEYGRLSGQRPDQVEEQEPNPLKEDGARLRALEGEQAGDGGHLVGLAVGPRPAGLAHRVLGDGRGDLRPGLRDPRRRARPRLPAPRERGRAVALGRASVRARSGRTTGCFGSPARRCRSRSAT